MTTPENMPEADPYCFICSRATDHFAEHDYVVQAGLAVYEDDGSVVKTHLWDDDLARILADAEYDKWLADYEAESADRFAL